VVGGRAPADTTGWMRDISVPGDGDHDFYIATTIATILVHNCPESDSNPDRNGLARAGRAFQKHYLEAASRGRRLRDFLVVRKPPMS
jgi:hypothetical protein